MKFKKWLIKKIGGYTVEEVAEKIHNITKHSVIQELEQRVRGGNGVVIGVRNMASIQHLRHMFSNECIVSIPKGTITYHDIVFKVINITDRNHLDKIRGMNLNGFFFID